ncbi:MAG: hypothetical protein ACYCO4_02175 [Sulfobacillus sp.]
MGRKRRTADVVKVIPAELPVPLTRITMKGPVRIAFWALRVYILVMLILVAIGFTRGLH